MGFLNETGGNLRAIWKNLPFAARCSVTLVVASLVAIGAWWSQRAPETSYVVLFPGQQLAQSELVAMEAAFGRARLNGARLVDGQFSVPADHKDDYVRALLDHDALPATPASFSERLIAQDNLFTSPRQREALMKLAQEREVALMVRQIAGIAEATVHYEDVEGQGFPRRKTRRATVAVRPRAERPLAQPVVHAIRATVANSLGVERIGDVAVLDLNEGVAYADVNTDPNPTPGDPSRSGSPGSPKQIGERANERAHEPTSEPIGPIELANFLAPEATGAPRRTSIPGHVGQHDHAVAPGQEPDRSPANATTTGDGGATMRPASPKSGSATSEPLDAKSDGQSEVRSNGPSDGPTRGAPPANDDGRSASRENPGDTLRDRSENAAREPAEPRRLPMSILRMVRPISEGRVAPRDGAVVPASHSTSVPRSPTRTSVATRKTAPTKSSPPANSSAHVRASTTSAQARELSRDVSQRPVADMLERAAQPEWSNSGFAARWPLWLRDHGPTFGGFSAGLGALAWLLRALRSAPRGRRTEERSTDGPSSAKRENRREQIALSEEQTHDRHAGAPFAESLNKPLGPALDASTAGPSDARRELTDHVRENTSSAAAKLRQWLGHAA